MAAARGGERAALDQLLRRHYDRIHAVCSRIAGASRDADDACQEAVIKIVRNLGSFDGRSAFSTWAYRIATNAALDELRKRQRRPALRAAGEDDGHDGQDQLVDDRAAATIDAISERLAIDTALDQLDPDFRAAVTLRDVLDLDYGEIAHVLDIPLGTVKSRIARGRAALADSLRLEELPPLPPDDPDDAGNHEGTDERPNDLS